MSYRESHSVRLLYLSSLADGMRVTWPVISGLLIFQAALGTIVGIVEGWGVWRGVYFAFITALTIGYGDFVPRQMLTQVLAVAIGFSGIALTGMFAALAVRAFQATAMTQREVEIRTADRKGV